MSPFETEQGTQGAPETHELESKPEASKDIEVDREPQTKVRTTDEKTVELQTFQPTGDQLGDIETFLEITGRQNYLAEIRGGRIDAAGLLKSVKESRENSETTSDSEFSTLEIETINKILESSQPEATDNPDPKPSTTEESDGSDEGEEEGSKEESEKQEKLEQIGEKVESDFEEAKQKILEVENQYDALYSKAYKKLEALSKSSPNIITESVLGGFTSNNKVVKEVFANMVVGCDAGNKQIQDFLESLPMDYVSMDQIDSIKQSFGNISNVFESTAENTKIKLGEFERVIEEIPSPRDGEGNIKKLKETRTNILGHQIIGSPDSAEMSQNINQAITEGLSTSTESATEGPNQEPTDTNGETSVGQPQPITTENEKPMDSIAA